MAGSIQTRAAGALSVGKGICFIGTLVAASNWILAAGTWNDSGVWDDTASWID